MTTRRSDCQYTGMLSEQEFAAVLDVDFQMEAQRHQRRMGTLRRVELYGGLELPDGGLLPRYGDVLPVVPEADWPEAARENERIGGVLEKCVDMVKDQDGEVSCVSCATVSAFEIKTCMQLGSKHVTPLSPMSLYMRCGSRNSGSTLSKNLSEMLKLGALPLDTAANKARFPHVMSHNGYGQRYPAGWESTAAMFRFGEYADIGDLYEMVSALLSGHPVIYARNGHCILAIGITYRDGAFYLKYLNSWGGWGVALNAQFAYGVGLDSLRVARSAAYGSIALIGARLPPMPEPALATAL